MIIRVPVQSEQDNISVNGQNVESMKNFVYFGVMITEHYDASRKSKRSNIISKNAIISLVKIWKHRAISITTKKRLLTSLVFSIATYESECWILETTDKKKINSFELWCY